VSAVPAGAVRHWGWHRLTPQWAAQLVADAGIKQGDLVLDVGAGTGAITEQLVRAGARVVAVELHPARHRELVDRFRDDDVVVVRADGQDLRLPRRDFRVVSNPPFAITTSLMRRLLSPGSRLVAAHLVVPTGVARRWCDGRAPGACRWTRTYALHVGRRVPPTAFRPSPPAGCVQLVVRRA
jgi:23S rRNA (adenine-N6)-dimethyltransferase